MAKELHRFEAVLVGVAVGDAYGRPFEIGGVGPQEDWLSPDRVELSGIRVGDRYAYSDDTETTLILAESIVRGCGFTPLLFAQLLAEKADIDNPVRGYGIAVASTVAGLRRGIPWWITARNLYGGAGSMGNGAVVRVPPIPLFYDSIETIEYMAVSQSYITHTNPVALEGARLHALAIHYALHDVPPSKIVTILVENTFLDVYRVRLKAVKSLLGSKPKRVAEIIGNSALAYESFAAAVYAFVAADGDPLTTLYYALSLGGDSDSIAAMATALALAYAGRLDRELSRLAEKVEAIDYVKKIARDLFEARRKCLHQQAYDYG